MLPRLRAWFLSVWRLCCALAAVIYLAALAVHADRFLPGGKWTLLPLAIIAVPVMFLAALIMLKVKSFWNRLEFKGKLLLVFVLSVLYLFISFLVNRRKPYPMSEDMFSATVLLLALFLWGLYSLMSRGLDALWFRITRRKHR